MRTRVRYLAFLVIVVFLSIELAAPMAFADDGSDHGKTVFGDDYVLESGEELQGDLAVFGGDATLLQESLVTGNVLAMGGSVSVAGTVDGDVAVFGGDVRLEATCEVEGDIVALGGSVTRQEGAVVRGQISEGFSFDFMPRLRLPAITRPEIPGIPNWETPWRSWWSGQNLAWTWFTRGLRALATVIVLVVLAIVVVALWPQPAQRIADTVQRNPGATIGMGLLTLLVVPGLLVLLSILLVTLCVVPILALAAAVAFLFGWIGLGLLVGQRLLSSSKARNAPALWQAALGVAVITLVGSLPCVGWLAWVVGGAFGLGAVVLTRFGSQRYSTDVPAALPPAPPPMTTEPEVPAEAAPVQSQEPLASETSAEPSGPSDDETMQEPE